jgi:hypothetical protein
MKVITFAGLFVAFACAASAQNWDFGVTGGGSLLNSVGVTGTAGPATAGFEPGFTAGVFAGDRLYDHITGEAHYDYMATDLRLSAGGQSATFGGHTQAIHYDLIWHTAGGESNTQFFAVLGGGLKAFSGTGQEQALQPLSQYGYFTKTQSFKPMVTGGVGVNFRLSSSMSIRAEVRDYVSAFPTGVLTPPTGVKYGSVLQQIVPMVSLVYEK